MAALAPPSNSSRQSREKAKAEGSVLSSSVLGDGVLFFLPLQMAVPMRLHANWTN